MVTTLEGFGKRESGGLQSGGCCLCLCLCDCLISIGSAFADSADCEGWLIGFIASVVVRDGDSFDLRHYHPGQSMIFCT